MLLGSQMLQMAEIAADDAQARAMLKAHIEDGSGLKHLQRMFELLGGDASYVNVEGMRKLVAVKRLEDLTADSDGYVTSMDAEKIGTAAQMLGAGRATKEDKVDPAVGLKMHVRVGYPIRKGDILCTLYINREDGVEDAKRLLKEAIHITDGPVETEPMVYGLVTANR